MHSDGLLTPTELIYLTPGVQLDMADVLEIAGEAAISRPHISHSTAAASAQGKVSAV
jgi:hypothetical protein